jgi:hypothetical protein
MPNGASSPLAKTSFSGSPDFVGRSTRTRPAALSATKMSPLGAARIRRGSSRFSANKVMANPGGTTGFSLAVRRTMRTPLEKEAARSAGGTSAGLMWRMSPGRSACQSVKAALPSRIGGAAPWVRAAPDAKIPPPTAAAAANVISSRTLFMAGTS